MDAPPPTFHLVVQIRVYIINMNNAQNPNAPNPQAGAANAENTTGSDHPAAHANEEGANGPPNATSGHVNEANRSVPAATNPANEDTPIATPPQATQENESNRAPNLHDLHAGMRYQDEYGELEGNNPTQDSVTGYTPAPRERNTQGDLMDELMVHVNAVLDDNQSLFSTTRVSRSPNHNNRARND